MRIGVLALQGDFREHAQMLRKLGVEVVEVRLRQDLANLDGLIIPGGESTTIGKLLERCAMLDELRRLIRAGLPVYGTCAGAIVLARDIGRRDQPLIGLMEIKVERNGFGRQIDSFEAELVIAPLGDTALRAVFIRAPRIVSVGPAVQVLARLDDGAIVAAQEGHLLVTSFHPELTGDDRFHRYFVSVVEQAMQTPQREAGSVR